MNNFQIPASAVLSARRGPNNRTVGTLDAILLKSISTRVRTVKPDAEFTLE